MIYTTGTIAVNGNTVNGTGTNFTQAGSLIRVGCTIIVMSSPVQVFQITSINSATQLTVTPSASPEITSGTRYSILLSDSLSVDGLAQSIAETFTMYQKQMSGFADVMNASGDVTITINGAAVTVPGQKSLAKKTDLEPLAKKIDLEPLAKKSDLGNGKAGPNLKDVMLNGYAGLGVVGGHASFNLTNPNTLYSQLRSYGFCTFRNDNALSPPGYTIPAYSPSFFIKTNDTYAIMSFPFSNGDIRVLTGSDGVSSGGWATARSLWDSTNTTVDGNGFIKKASPIVRLVNDAEVMADNFLEGFTLSGLSAVNKEASGVVAEKISTGVYKVSGSLGFAADGWHIEGPQDVNGNRLCFIDAETSESGEITVRVSSRKFDIEACAVVADQPMDIPDGRWIDLRLKMVGDEKK